MGHILKEFRLEEYTRRRMRELRGRPAPVGGLDPDVEEYITRRLRELRAESKKRKSETHLDRWPPSRYTVSTVRRDDVFGRCWYRDSPDLLKR